MKTTWERFMCKVEITDKCWLWKGAQNGKGYGQFWNGERTIPAHWFLLPEYPPEGKEGCHHCDNRICVRPSHIFIGTRSENMLDCSSKGRINRTSIISNRNRRKTWHKGEENHASKLTKEQALKAKKCSYKYGEATKLAREFGVSLTVICDIRDGKRWTHL